MNNLKSLFPSRKVAVLTSAAAVAFAGVAVASPHVVGALQATPDEFVWSPSIDGPLYLNDGTTSTFYGGFAAGTTNYKVQHHGAYETEDPNSGYVTNDYQDFINDTEEFVFSYGLESRFQQGLLYDAGANAGSRYAYMVIGRDVETNYWNVVRFDHNGNWEVVSKIDDLYESDNDRNFTMLADGALVQFHGNTGILRNYGPLDGLTQGYPFDPSGNSDGVPLMLPTESSIAGPSFSTDVSVSTLTVDGTEYVLVWKRGGGNNVYLYNATTLNYVGELDMSSSVDMQGATDWWGSVSVVESAATVGNQNIVQYAYDYPLARTGAYGSLAVLNPADVDVSAMTASLSTRASNTAYVARESVGIQAPASTELVTLPDAPPGVSHLDYDVNGGSSAAPDMQTGEIAATTTVSSTTPTYDGYNFASWNTADDGSGIDYAAGGNYTLPSTAGVTDTVYAQWAQAPGTASCSSSPTGFIQAIKGLEGDDIVSFKLLDLEAGDYVDMDPAVSLDLAALGFGGTGGFNATAIDKATGKMFATINDGEDLWLVQFDLEPTPNVAFLGKVRHPDTQGGFSGTVTSDGTYVMNYYITGLVEIPNVSSLTTYGSPEAASGVLLGTVHETNVLGWHGDLATITLSDNSEHVVGYNPGTNKVVLAPVDDLSNPVAYTTTFPSSFNSSGENLGASWSTGDTVYFSRNDGGGVFAVSADDIDVNAQELIMHATSVTSTVSTSSNDGFGCVPAADEPEVVRPATSSSLACSAWPGLIWVQNQGDTPTNDYQAANTSQFFMFDAGSGDLDADGLDDASTWVYDDAALGYDLSINATGVDPTSNIMYGTANVDGVAYVASFAPGANPVFYAQGRVDASDVSISNTANGFVDAEGHYWIKDSSGPLYRSQQPLSSYTGYADRNVVTDPMVFDAIGSENFGSVSDIAVIPVTDGYLVAGFVWNTLYWGTWNSTTNTWTSGANASVATGTASPGDYGAVFVDGVTSDGGTLDYSGASIYFTPNAGWDPETSSGRRPVKIAVADALDGITSDDLVLLESTPTPATGSNDGASVVGCGLQLPDPLGGLHGWMWADIDGDGSRTAVEPTDGMFGDEAVITGYTATVISETDWTTLQGVVAVPAGTRYPATVDADGKWSVDGLAAGADPTGVVQTFKVEFDYTGATMPTDFTPEGYTVKGGSTGTDSDVPVTAGAAATSIGGFTVSADSSSHAADAGITTPMPALPVVFEEQGGSEVGDLTCEVGGSFTVSAAPTRDGYTFAGWNSAADGTGTAYAVGSTVDCADLTIYAIWAQEVIELPATGQDETRVQLAVLVAALGALSLLLTGSRRKELQVTGGR